VGAPLRYMIQEVARADSRQIVKSSKPAIGGGFGEHKQGHDIGDGEIYEVNERQTVA